MPIRSEIGPRARYIIELTARVQEATQKAEEARARGDFGTWVHQNRRACKAAHRLQLINAPDPVILPPVELPPVALPY